MAQGARRTRIRLVNRTRGTVLAEDVERATSLAARLRGLIGRRRLDEGAALCIEPCTSIHTLFMRFPIDAAFLDRDDRVLRSVASLRPWRGTRFHFRAAKVVELPEGALVGSGTREGDFLAFERV